MYGHVPTQVAASIEGSCPFRAVQHSTGYAWRRMSWVHALRRLRAPMHAHSHGADTPEPHEFDIVGIAVPITGPVYQVVGGFELAVCGEPDARRCRLTQHRTSA